MLPATTDVLIIGAGPTGLTTAVSLLARGREVTVIDNQQQQQHTSRASVVYSRTLELLEPYGVAQQLTAQGIHARRFTIRDRDKVLMNVPFDWLPTAYPYTLLVSQAVTESVLQQRLRQLGGSVLRPYCLTSLDPDAGGVTARFESGERIRAGYVVGADGVHSTVRAQAGISFKASAAGASYSLADVHLSGGVPADEVAVFFAPEGQLVCVPFPDGSYKLVANVTEAPPEPGVSFMQDLVDTRGPRADRPVIKDIVWGSRFLVQHGVADRFHAGRIALAGDAAHHNSPLGGQGMNAGIGDAAALGNALDAALERGSTDPLEAYTAAQRPVAEQVVAITNTLTWLATMDGQLRTLRNITLAMLNPIASRRLARRLSMLVYRQ
jgi:2-polyprenyl-6-methoxyphenol hydroxylase-like FAD-dependent oxidoreductase